MDIKTALMSGGSRKRKASTSEPCQIEVKTIKLSSESHEVEILDEACGITVNVQPPTDMALGDCKENRDINSSQISDVDSKENILLIKSKDDGIDFRDSVDVNVINNSLLRPMSSSSPIKTKSELSESEMCDTSGNFDTSACDDLNASIVSSAKDVSLNASQITGDENDAKGERSASAAGDSTKTSTKVKTEAKLKKKKMTPAEAQKRAEERERKQKEKLLKKQELENKKKERQLEKDKKAKEKLLRKEREELERKEREKIKQEKKELEEKERLLKLKEKEEKIQKKLEEQKKKEEMKQKKEEEQKKAEEEKLKKEQKEKERAEKAKAAFVNFFKRDSSASAPIVQAKVPEKEGAFLPFQVLDDMTLAPVVPPAAQERFDRKQLEKFLESQDCKELYLQTLRSGSYKDVRQRKRSKTLATSDADVIVIDENAKNELSLTAKLLQFADNIRPPYWGTWRKKSKNIRPRNPFGQDEIFDYDVDSDDEWDEGGPGESLSGTEAEDESEDDYEVDNEFFVPHGYLSDEEEKVEDDEEELNNDPEKQKALLKKKLQEFEMERKKKTTELKPIILGCYFENDPKFQDSGVQLFLQKFAAEILSDGPIPTRFTVKKLQVSPSGSPKSSLASSAKKKKGGLVPEDAMPQLIRHIHGNMRNRRVLAQEFQKLWTDQHLSSESKPETPLDSSSMEVDSAKNVAETGDSENTAAESETDCSLISVQQLKIRIKEIATYGKPPEPSINKCCWWVNENVREKYGLINAPLPTDKSYVSFSAAKVEDKLLPASNSASIKEFLSS